MSTSLSQSAVPGREGDPIATMKEIEAAYVALCAAMPPSVAPDGEDGPGPDKDVWVRLDEASPLVWILVASLYVAMLLWVSH